MIEVTRLNGIPILLNSDLVKIAESSPDTMLTLVNGEKLIVRESCEEVMERILAYRARLLTRVAQRMKSLDGICQLAGSASLDADKQGAFLSEPVAKR